MCCCVVCDAQTSVWCVTMMHAISNDVVTMIDACWNDVTAKTPATKIAWTYSNRMEISFWICFEQNPEVLNWFEALKLWIAHAQSKLNGLLSRRFELVSINLFLFIFRGSYSAQNLASLSHANFTFQLWFMTSFAFVWHKSKIQTIQLSKLAKCSSTFLFFSSFVFLLLSVFNPRHNF